MNFQMQNIPSSRFTITETVLLPFKGKNLILSTTGRAEYTSETGLHMKSPVPAL